GPSVASYVALPRAVVNLPDVYEVPPERPYEFDDHWDTVHGYRTRSMLAMPLRDGRGEVFGVIQLINALGDAGAVVAFGQEGEEVVTALLAQFARDRKSTRLNSSYEWISYAVFCLKKKKYQNRERQD